MDRAKCDDTGGERAARNQATDPPIIRIDRIVSIRFADCRLPVLMQINRKFVGRF